MKMKLVAWGSILVTLYFAYLKIIHGSFIYSLFSLVFILILAANPLIKKERYIGIAPRNICMLIGILLAVAYVCGTFLECKETLWGDTTVDFIVFIIGCVVYSVLLGFSVDLLFSYLESGSYEYKIKRESGPVFKKSFFVLAWVVILLCWIPVWLAYFPGILAYDAHTQLAQYTNHKISTFQPPVHTLLLALFYEIGIWFQDLNIGVALYSVVQMICVSFSFAAVVFVIWKKTASRFWYFAALIYFSLFIPHAILAISTTKDIYFSVMVLWIIILLLEREELESKNKYLYLFFMVLFVAGALLLRNNALYAFIAVAIIWLLFIRKSIKKILPLLLGICVYLVLQTGLTHFLDVEPGSNREMLSVPLQQLARVAATCRDSLSEEEIRKIEEYIYPDLQEHYDPYLSDVIKDYATIEGKGITESVMLWAQLGIRYPKEYIESIALNTIGFWYLDDITNSAIYGAGYDSRMGYLLTDYKELTGDYQVSHISLLPQLEVLCEYLFSANYYQQIPFLSILCSLALYFWILVIITGYMWYQKDYKGLLPCSILLVYTLTLFLGPTAIVRYIYPVMICTPLLIGYVVKSKREEEK